MEVVGSIGLQSRILNPRAPSLLSGPQRPPTSILKPEFYFCTFDYSDNVDPTTASFFCLAKVKRCGKIQQNF